MTPTPTSDRYSLAVRRGWLLCLAFMLLGAVAFPMLTRRGRTASSAAVAAIVYDAPSVQLAELTSDVFTHISTFRADLAAAQSATLEASAERVARANLDVGVVPDEAARRMRILVSGPTKSATDAALDVYIEALRARRRAIVEAALSEFERAAAQMRPVAERRVAQLDAQLKELGTGNSLLAEALQAERTERADDLLRIENQRQALRGYADAPNANVTVTDRENPSDRVGVQWSSIVVGAIFGVVVAVAGIVLATFTRPRLRTRSDVQRLLGNVPVIAVPAADAGGVASFVRRVGSRSPVSILTDPALRSADHWRAAAGTDAVGPWRLPFLPDEASPENVLLVVDWGRTRDATLVAVACGVQAIGRRVVGVAVANVPQRYAEHSAM